MLRRDLRQIWNSCAPSIREKEECLEQILKQRTKDTDIRGIQWKPKGRLAPWLVIVLLIVALIVSVYHVADIYGVVDRVSEWADSVVPTVESTETVPGLDTTETTQKRAEVTELTYKPLAAKYVQAIQEDLHLLLL